MNNRNKQKKAFNRENMIKARIAESLIEELFLAMEYDVFRYGMENTVPGAKNLLQGIENDVAYNIRRMPDFVIHKDGKVFFVEVKYRADEKFNKKEDLEKSYPYKNCYFIIVSKKHIQCITYEELEKGLEITPQSFEFYLNERKEFDLNKETIVEFCEYARKFFKEI